MSSLRSFICLLLFSALLWLFINSCNRGPGNHSSDSGQISSIALQGKQIFESICVRCHGMDGSGLTGPSLKRNKLIHAPDPASFNLVIEQGIPGTGMPGNWALTDQDGAALYEYIKTLRNQDEKPAPGDSATGRKIFETTGCFTCHQVNGEGMGIGPDLSFIGTERNSSYLRESINEPGKSLPESSDPDNSYGFSLYLPVKIKTKDNQEITGLRLNEDTYTIQVKDLQNHYYSFIKDSLATLEKLYNQSLMPSYNTTLSEKQKVDLLAYLSKLGNQ